MFYSTDALGSNSAIVLSLYCKCSSCIQNCIRECILAAEDYIKADVANMADPICSAGQLSLE